MFLLYASAPENGIYPILWSLVIDIGYFRFPPTTLMYATYKRFLTSALWTPTLLIIPQGRIKSYAIFSAGLSPTISNTTSAPRPSVASKILCLRVSGLSVAKLSGSAPSDFASSRREGTESTAKICFGLKEVTAMRAHSPTGPHPITTTVVSEHWLGVSWENAFLAAK